MDNNQLILGIVITIATLAAVIVCAIAYIETQRKK